MTLLLSLLLLGVKEIDIAASLEHIRDQRPGLVRTKVPSICVLQYLRTLKVDGRHKPTVSLCPISNHPFHTSHASIPSLHLCLSPARPHQDQFEFALTAVAEEVNAILKALPQ